MQLLAVDVQRVHRAAGNLAGQDQQGCGLQMQMPPTLQFRNRRAVDADLRNRRRAIAYRPVLQATQFLLMALSQTPRPVPCVLASECFSFR